MVTIPRLVGAARCVVSRRHVPVATIEAADVVDVWAPGLLSLRIRQVKITCRRCGKVLNRAI